MYDYERSKTAKEKVGLKDLERLANIALTRKSLTEDFIDKANWAVASSEGDPKLRSDAKFKKAFDSLGKAVTAQEKALNDIIIALKALQR